MNLADPELELIDPTPNVHALFVQFDIRFFWGKLASRAVVRWSKRMYSCAGICSYEGRGGLCDVALSEPLLKLRPRKDLIETLLHEMIHAYLFIVGGDRNRDGHGPIFQSHMHRINREAGLNISVYHNFHDEVRLYQTHWWRCNGPCQYRKPFFGIVRRSCNRAPNQKDFWWESHQRMCGGTFVKIKEPEKTNNNKTKTKSQNIGDITKFLYNTSNVKTLDTINTAKPVVKSTSLTNLVGLKNIPVNNVKTFNDLCKKVQGDFSKVNGGGTVVVTQKKYNFNKNGNLCTTSNSDKYNKSIGKKDTNRRHSINSENVIQVVRNVWANKQIDSNKSVQQTNTCKKRNSSHVAENSPPSKLKKIDTNNCIPVNSKIQNAITDDLAASLLKDIYGTDFKIYHKTEKQGDKTIAVTHPDDPEIVACPLCNIKVQHSQINNHIDECLNRAEIEKIQEETKNNAVERDSKPRTSGFLSTSNVKNSTEVVDLTVLGSEHKKCPCCDKMILVPMEEHLEDCLSFFNNNNTVPKESTPNATVKNEEISNIDSFFDDDSFVDELDESGVFNETGTKYPCPCCFLMIEETQMNHHLDNCLPN